MLGLLYQEGWGVQKDLIEAAKWFRKAADQGKAGAQSSLGSCYTNGTGVEKNDVEAVKWYRKAADQGEVGAQYNLGASYYTGIGVEKDMVEAAKWFHKAADQGNATAQFSLGLCYYKGTGIEKDYTEAAKWFRLAADQGYAAAQCVLGICYHDGDGVEKDVVEAAKWYRKAADQGYAEAQGRLGSAYIPALAFKKMLSKPPSGYAKQRIKGMQRRSGSWDISTNTEVAWKKTQLKQRSGIAKPRIRGRLGAQFSLGLCYYNGTGVDKDAVEAAKWSRKAADQGNAGGQAEIGLLFIEGLGVIKNEVEGLAWLYVSSANGNEGAAKVISSKEKIYSASIISAARDRATEIQAQIASHPAPANNDSATAILPLAPAPNTPKASGSGAFISADGLILTAAHVVQGASRIEVVTAAGKLVATVVKIDATNDVALLKCTGSNFAPLPIAPSKEARPGTSVFTVGFPNIQLQGFDPKLTKGEISSQTGFQDDPRQWQISVPIQPGNSGGPLCDENGNLIGIVLATLDPLKMAKLAGEIPQNVNYAVKSSYIIPLLDDVQNLPQPLTVSSGAKFEDVVGKAQKSVVLILVY